MSPANWGLVVFLAVLTLDLAGLTLDLGLFLGGARTISEHVWARPLLGVPILAWQEAGAAALAVHLYWGPA